MKEQLVIKPAETMSEIKKGIQFRIKLYENNAFSVPPLIENEMNTLNRKRNPAYEFAESQTFLAYRGGRIVGRITGIIHHRANETWNKKSVRFTFFDFVDDREVSEALIRTVEQWGKSKGMVEIEGPLGFTDMDQEGMLIEGFDQLGTTATFYNYAYYPQHMEALGFEKAADWKEFKIEIVAQIPERYTRVADIVRNRFKLRNVKYSRISELIEKGYGTELFNLVNKSFAHLHGFTQMTQRQIDTYVKLYVPMLNPRLISLVVDENDRLVGMGVSMPSLSKAMQKAKGRLFPFGWIHLLKALKMQNDIVDLLLIAVDPEYQGKGVNALLFADLQVEIYKMGFKYAESNPELEVNEKVQAQWDSFPHKQHKRRRAYRKDI